MKKRKPSRQKRHGPEAERLKIGIDPLAGLHHLLRVPAKPKVGSHSPGAVKKPTK